MTKPNGQTKEETIIPFPCDFTVKIMGKNQPGFDQQVISLVQQHFPKVDLSRIQQKLSKDNNFLSLSIIVYAESKMQLDALYQTLSSTKEILMVL